MKFFAILAIPAMVLASTTPMVAEDNVITARALPALPLNVECTTGCLAGITSCTPTNLASLTGLVGCPVGVVLCALNCILTGATSGSGAGGLGASIPIVGPLLSGILGTVGGGSKKE